MPRRLRLRWRSFYRLDGLDVFDKPRPDLGSKLLWKVLEANPVRYFMRYRVGRHTAIYALATRILHNFLIVELELFREIVDSYLLLTSRHN